MQEISKIIGVILLSIVVVLGAALLGRWVVRITHDISQTERMAAIQNTMSNTAIRNNDIDRLARATLTKMPSAARIRIAFIHQDEIHTTPTILIDITNVVANEGYPAGDMQTNVPISVWNDFLPAMLQHHCTMVRRSDLTVPMAVNRMKEMKIMAVQVCPIFNADNILLGGSFVSWDDLAMIPTDLTDIEVENRKLAALLGQLVGLSVR